MKNGKFAKRGIATKVMLVILAVMLVAGISVGGTLAWLSANTGTVTNTFTYGDITIDLYEHTYDADKNELTKIETREGVNNYTIIPGLDLPKDPTVVVEAGSEDSWVFIEIVESADWTTFNNKVTYAIADGWTPLADENKDGIADNGVYYREYTGTAKATYAVLKGNQVAVSGDLTKTEISTMKNQDGSFKTPSLKFTAYAVQRDASIEAIDTAAEAWAIAKPATP